MLLPDRVAVAARGEVADRLAVAQDRLAPDAAPRRDRRRVKPAKRLVSGCRAVASSASRPMKSAVRLQLHRPAEPRLERRVVRRDVGAPGAIALLQPQRFQRAIADRPECRRLAAAISASKTAPVAAMRDVQFPAEFADIGHAQRPDRVPGDGDLADMAEGKGGVATRRRRSPRQHVARLRAHQRQRAPILGHVADRHVARREGDRRSRRGRGCGSRCR